MAGFSGPLWLPICRSSAPSPSRSTSVRPLSHILGKSRRWRATPSSIPDSLVMSLNALSGGGEAASEARRSTPRSLRIVLSLLAGGRLPGVDGADVGALAVRGIARVDERAPRRRGVEIAVVGEHLRHGRAARLDV